MTSKSLRDPREYSLGPDEVLNGFWGAHNFSSKHLQMVLHVKIKI